MCLEAEQVRPTVQDVMDNLVERFGPDRDLASQFEKLREEFFELLDAWAGIDGASNEPEPPEGWAQNFEDELADVVIVCMAIAGTRGFDLDEAVAAKWARRKRGRQ